MKYRFQPRLILTLLFVVLFALFLRLGIWQLDRADEKRQILQHYQAMSQLPPLKTLPSKGISRYELHNRKIELRGQFLGQRQFLHDNQIHQGVVGYHVLTPFRDQASGLVVLVNRGWVAMPQLRRDILPSVALGDAQVTIRGTIYVPPGAAISFDEQGAVGEGWPKVIQTVEPRQMQSLLPYSLADYRIRLAAESEPRDGYVRQWSLIAASPEQSTSYAFQWFAMAAALLVLYIVLNLKRKQ